MVLKAHNSVPTVIKQGVALGAYMGFLFWVNIVNKVMRWDLFLWNYRFQIRQVKGKAMCTDYLSRIRYNMCI